MTMPLSRPPLPCRLCGAETVPRFEGDVLGRIPTTWWHCPECDCLQTDPPHWLDEAYRPENRALDTGIAQRTLSLSFLLPVLLSAFGVTESHRWLDQGGGTGLLCRLMRDRGFDAWRHDPFCPNHFALGFDKADAPPGPWPLVTLFEVLEHLPNPAEDILELAALDADVIIASTTVYDRQASAWPYLSVDIGQHVFFWSIKGLEILAERLGMRLVTVADLHVLIRPTPRHLSYDVKAVLDTVRVLRDRAQALVLGLNAFAGHLPHGFERAMEDSRKCQDDLERRRGQATRLPRPLSNRPARRGPDRGPRVLVDGVFFQHMLTGIGRYWDSVLREWGRSAFGAGVTLLDRAGTAPRIPGLRHRIISPHAFGQWDGEARRLQDICDEERADVFLSTYYTGPTRTPALMVVYDMIPERVGYDLTEAMWTDKNRAIATAARHVCISEATRTDLCDLGALDPAAIAIAYPGVDHAVFHPPLPEEAERVARSLFLPDRYFLAVGGLEGHKNGQVLFEAMRGDPTLRTIPLIVACPRGALDDAVRADAHGLTVLAHRFTDAELNVAYARASALVIPSLLEGFSMPLAEGAAAGASLVCSDIPLFQEVVGDAAIRFSPRSPEDLRKGLRQALDGPETVSRRAQGLARAARYDWTTCAAVLESQIRALIPADDAG